MFFDAHASRGAERALGSKKTFFGHVRGLALLASGLPYQEAPFGGAFVLPKGFSA